MIMPLCVVSWAILVRILEAGYEELGEIEDKKIVVETLISAIRLSSGTIRDVLDDSSK